jgi:hypothetical protein
MGVTQYQQAWLRLGLEPLDMSVTHIPATVRLQLGPLAKHIWSCSRGPGLPPTMVAASKVEHQRRTARQSCLAFDGLDE